MEMQWRPLVEVIDGCRAESARFRSGEAADAMYCFELIRRAVCDRVQAAWEAVLTQYQGMVLFWVRQHPASASTIEEDAYWVNRAFERFWSAVGPERFGLFPNLAAVLRYLKMCVHSTLLDEVRARGPAITQADLPDLAGDAAHALATMEADVAALALERLGGRELWEAISRELTDDLERLVVRLSFVLALKPGEIYERHADRFADVTDVYRIKRNVIERLRRSPAILAFAR